MGRFRHTSFISTSIRGKIAQGDKRKGSGVTHHSATHVSQNENSYTLYHTGSAEESFANVSDEHPFFHLVLFSHEVRHSGDAAQSGCLGHNLESAQVDENGREDDEKADDEDVVRVRILRQGPRRSIVMGLVALNFTEKEFTKCFSRG